MECPQPPTVYWESTRAQKRPAARLSCACFHPFNAPKFARGIPKTASKSMSLRCCSLRWGSTPSTTPARSCSYGTIRGAGFGSSQHSAHRKREPCLWCLGWSVSRHHGVKDGETECSLVRRAPCTRPTRSKTTYHHNNNKNIVPIGKEGPLWYGRGPSEAAPGA